MMCSTSLILSFVLSRELTLGMWTIVFSAGSSTLEDVVDVGAGVEEVADVELLQVLVAVELLVVGVGDGIELRLVLRGQHGLGVAAEIGAGHRDDVRLVAGDELRRDARRACCRGWPRRGGTRRRRSAGRRTPRRRTRPRRSGTSRGCRPAPCRRSSRNAPTDLTLPPLSVAGRVAEVPLRLDVPVGPEAVLGQRLVVEAGADGLLRHDDDGLLQALVLRACRAR